MLEPPALIAGLHDVAVVGQSVEQRGGHLGVAKYLAPFPEAVNSTPTFFVNGKRLAGAVPLDQFKAIIDPELAKGS